MMRNTIRENPELWLKIAGPVLWRFFGVLWPCLWIWKFFLKSDNFPARQGRRKAKNSAVFVFGGFLGYNGCFFIIFWCHSAVWHSVQLPRAIGDWSYKTGSGNDVKMAQKMAPLPFSPLIEALKSIFFLGCDINCFLVLILSQLHLNMMVHDKPEVEMTQKWRKS